MIFASKIFDLLVNTDYDSADLIEKSVAQQLSIDAKTQLIQIFKVPSFLENLWIRKHILRHFGYFEDSHLPLLLNFDKNKNNVRQPAY